MLASVISLNGNRRQPPPCLPDVKIVEEHGGTEYTVTGSYEGMETLDKKLRHIMEQNAADDKSSITEDADE